MKLYGHPFSSCTRRVLITLAEKNMKADFVTIDLGKGEQKNPDFLVKQPFGVIPVLEDEGFSLYESRAICRYLDRKFLNSSLTPKNQTSFAKMEQWISIEQSYLNPATGKIFHNLVLKPMRGAETDRNAVEEGKKEAHHMFNVMNKELRSQAYLAGEEFSLADVFVMSHRSLLEASKHSDIMDSYPHVLAWWNRVSARPSWKQFANQK